MPKKCSGKASVTIRVEFPVDGEFNPLYTQGIEELKAVAKEMVFSGTPSDVAEFDVLDVSIENYEESLINEPSV